MHQITHEMKNCIATENTFATAMIILMSLSIAGSILIFILRSAIDNYNQKIEADYKLTQRILGNYNASPFPRSDKTHTLWLIQKTLFIICDMACIACIITMIAS